MGRWLKTGLLYYLMVFGAGFAFGVIRRLVFSPVLGEPLAELIEIPPMLIVIWYAAKFVVRHCQLSRLRAGLGAGLVALVLMVASELALVIALNQQSLLEYLAAQMTPAGIAYGVSLLIYTLLPGVLTHRQSNSL